MLPIFSELPDPGSVPLSEEEWCAIFMTLMKEQLKLALMMLLKIIVKRLKLLVLCNGLECQELEVWQTQACIVEEGLSCRIIAAVTNK